MDKKPEKLFIIDGHALLYRSYYALINRPLRNKQGMNTSALFGFVKALIHLQEEEEPEHLICTFDMRGPTFRHKIFKDYKAKRPPMPDELAAQIPFIFRLLEQGGVDYLSREGYESDDLIGSIVRLGRERGWHCYMVTNDKDLMQFVGEGVWMYNLKKNGEKVVMGPREVCRHLGVAPEQVVDFLSLAGDSSDNIPGVRGIGPKSAAILLEEFGDLDSLLAGLDKVEKRRWRELIEKHRADLELSRRLVAIEDGLEIATDVLERRHRGLNIEALRPLFEELGFKSLLRGTTSAPSPAERRDAGAGRDYGMVKNLEELKALLPELQQAGLLALDCETDSVDVHTASLVGLSLSPRLGFARYLPFTHKGGSNLDRGKALELLRPVLEGEHPPKAGSNLKFDLLVLRQHGLELKGLSFDSMLAAYLLDPEGRHGLKAVAASYLGREMTEIEELIGKGAKAVTMVEVDAARASEYSCADAEACLELAPILKKKLVEQELEELYTSLEMPLVDVLADMETRGAMLDTGGLKKLSRRLGRELARLEKEIHREAGEEFNIDSPKQLRVILFEKKGIKPLKKTKSGPSTDSEVLSRLASEYPLARLVLDYRLHKKIQSTYVDALPRLVHPGSGKVHTSFNQAVAATGRLSSSRPNLQNIPIRGELGLEVRRCFIPGRKGWRLISADYSQIELRVLAHLCRDETLLSAFNQGEDIHAQTAGELFSEEEMGEDEKRRLAKVINYGVLYGMGSRKFSRETGLPVKKASEYIERYFERYPGVKEYVEKVRREGKRKGYVTTLLGRRRLLPGLSSSSPLERSYAERVAVNTPIQGSAADILKKAMICIQRDMEGMQAGILLQVHDELLLEAPACEAEKVVELVRRRMSGAFPLAVPLEVNIGVGDNWAEIH